MTPSEIWNKAYCAAQRAAIAQNATLGDEYHRGFDCGFAWVVIKPARGEFVKYLKATNRGHKHCYGGFAIWYSQFSSNTQSVSVHEHAAVAFANVLKENGINCYTGSRLD